MFGVGWTQTQMQETALKRPKTFYSIEQGKNKKSLELEERRKDQVKLKNKAPSREKLRTRTVGGFTRNKTTHVVHRENST